MSVAVAADMSYSSGPLWYPIEKSLAGPCRTVMVKGVRHRFARYGLKISTLCRAHQWDNSSGCAAEVDGVVDCLPCTIVEANGGVYIEQKSTIWPPRGREQLRDHGVRTPGCYRVTSSSKHGD